jgi:hypothetical protein
VKGDLIEVGDKVGEIVRITYALINKIAIVMLIDSTRIKVDLNEYVWDDEKKVWKK